MSSNGGDGEGSGQLSLVSVAVGVASSLGLLGFVVFVGGAALWTRFNEMGLPAEHAVALVPNSELVATGATFLAPAAIGTAALALVLVLVSTIDATRNSSAPLVVLVVILAIAQAVIAAQALADVPLRVFMLLLAVAAATTTIVVFAYQRGNLAAFGLVAFLALGTFWLAVSYERTLFELKVMPMAYVREQPGKVPRVELGYFVAETSDRIYFASLPQATKERNELREFPRSETHDLEVGDLTLAQQAPAHAANFALNLCARLAALTSTTPTTTRQTPPCSQTYLAQLVKQATER